jgi:hypothetical protein
MKNIFDTIYYEINPENATNLWLARSKSFIFIYFTMEGHGEVKNNLKEINSWCSFFS